MLMHMEWIQYNTATRRRFGLTAQVALDALALEYDVVDVKRQSELSGLWTVEICGSAYDGFNRSIKRSLKPVIKRIKVWALRFYSADEAPAGRYAFRPPFTGVHRQVVTSSSSC